MKLQSYVCGSWQSGGARGVAMRDATTGETIGEASSDGHRLRRGARPRPQPRRPGTACDDLSRASRPAAGRSRSGCSELKEEFYALSYRTGATEGRLLDRHRWRHRYCLCICRQGGARTAERHVVLDGGLEGLSKSGSFVGQHLYLPREGAAIHINAFNFPVWGMLEKLAPAFLAGVPSIVKPATTTAYLTALVARRIIESGILPEGSLQLVCGGLGNTFEHLMCQDSVSFTGSAQTAAQLRVHPR